jgi:hypothetical protein
MVAKIKRGKTATPRGVILDITSRTFCPTHGESAKAGPKTRGILSGITKRYKENTPITMGDWRRFWSRSTEIKKLQAHLNHLLSICRVSRKSSLLKIVTGLPE